MTATDAFEDPAEREAEADNSFLESVSARLEEHFDTVRIICTRSRGTSTRLHTKGGGNYYGQLASVREWVTVQEEQTKENVRRNG